ncbi:MAG: hypothetical protein JWM58_437 [Rhizobium sp.]|nr:hypothetical protein [Rhizobium sp.]
MPIRAAVTGLLLLLLTIASELSAAESAYTTLNFDDSSCRQIGDAPTEEDISLGVVRLLCPGHRDYPVEYNSGDERTSVHYGDPSTATTESVWESFSPFNSVADKFEWRIENGVPFAAIHRFMISTGEEEPAPGTARGPVKGQVLVVSKVGQPGQPSGCVVGLVDALANPDANELARKIADELARGFQCGRDKAVYHGKRGDKSADLQTNFRQ